MTLRGVGVWDRRRENALVAQKGRGVVRGRTMVAPPEQLSGERALEAGKDHTRSKDTEEGRVHLGRRSERTADINTLSDGRAGYGASDRPPRGLGNVAGHQVSVQSHAPEQRVPIVPMLRTPGQVLCIK